MKSKKIIAIVFAVATLVTVIAQRLTPFGTTLLSKVEKASLTLAKQRVNQYAVAQVGEYQQHPNHEYELEDQNGSSWSHEMWKSNAVYQAIQREIDKAVSTGVSPILLAAGYQSEAKEHPGSALAQFKWSYAIWKSINPATPFIEKRTYSLAGFYSLVYAKSPDSYNYARLRYLLSPTSPNQRVLGEKLLDQDGNDVEVMAHLALDYAAPGLVSYSLTAKMRATQLSEELIKSNPQYARYYAILAEAFVTSYFVNGHHRQDGLDAIAAYKKYLSIARPNEDFYQDAKNRLADMEQRTNTN